MDNLTFEKLVESWKTAAKRQALCRVAYEEAWAKAYLYEEAWAKAYLESDGKNETARTADDLLAYEDAKAETKATEYRLNFALRQTGDATP